MTKRGIAVIAAAIFAGGVATGLALAGDAPAGEAAVKVVFDNARVSVREVTFAPGARRPARPRTTDELVLFPEEAHYHAVNADGKREPRDRAAGTVVFHHKGEQAPTLVNTSAKVVKYLNILLK